MKKSLFICTTAGIILMSTSILIAQGDSWTKVYNFSQDYRIYTLSFSDSLNGWAGGKKTGPVGIILSTKDGGANWTEQFTGTDYSWFNCIDFQDSLHGWAAGLYCLYKTSNGGKDWTQVPDSLFEFEMYTGLSDIQSVSFRDTSFGIIVGTESMIAVTSDGGATWNCSTVIPENGFIDSVYTGTILSDAKACVSGNGGVAISADMGRTWSVTHDEYRSYIKCYFINDGYGWVLSRDSQILHTKDYGNTWMDYGQIFQDDMINAVDISFTDSLSGWVITNQGIVWETHDGGINWESATISQDTALTAISAVPNKSVYVINSANNLYKSNRTTSVQGGYVGLNPEYYRLYYNYPNPFNPVTTIQYALPQAAHVQLSIYNLNGHLVEKLIDEQKTPGYYSVQWNATRYSSGVYLYRITAGQFTDVKKCILLK
ncbi:MAG: T9SS type A sorting domain-containing protein [Candidatus Marinimicrobia bacterium]|nr:T9SS type A sorting domain-containing protein [Candidatus Neomarinimicrobiota bacterium]